MDYRKIGGLGVYEGISGGSVGVLWRSLRVHRGLWGSMGFIGTLWKTEPMWFYRACGDLYGLWGSVYGDLCFP